MYETSSTTTVRAVAWAVVVALVLGIIWGFFRLWGFWFSVGAGFAIAEGIIRVTGARRGSTYQTIGMAAMVLCIVVSRVFMAIHAGLDPATVAQTLASTRVASAEAQAISVYLALDLPNAVYGLLGIAIPYVRFR